MLRTRRIGDRSLYQAEEEEEDIIQFGEGFSAGIAQTQAMYGGVRSLVNTYLGDEEEAREYLNYAQEKLNEAAEYGGTVTTIEEIDGAADAVRWLSYTAGTVIPSIATSIAGGGITGAAVQTLAKRGALEAVKKEVDDVVQDQATQAVKNTLIKNRLAASTASARTFGQAAGAFGTSASLEGGNAFLNIYNETGIKAPDVAALTGVISGALDAVVPFASLKKILPSKVFGDVKGEIVERAAQNNGLLKRAMVGGAQAAGVEGLTEAMQEFFQATAVGMMKENPEAELYQGYGQAMREVLYDWSKDPDSVYRSQFLNAFAAGMVGGGIMGGAAGALRKDGPEQVEDITKDKPPEDTPQTPETPQDPDAPISGVDLEPRVPFGDPAVAPSEPQNVVQGDFGSEVKAPDEPQTRVVEPQEVEDDPRLKKARDRQAEARWRRQEGRDTRSKELNDYFEALDLEQSKRILTGREMARTLIPNEIYEGQQLDPEANRVAGVEADKQLAIIQQQVKEPPVNVLPTGETIELGGPVAYTLKELIGKTVNYQGVEGILQQRDDGVFIVTTPEQDIPIESGESPSAVPAANLGVSPVDVEVDRPDPEVKYNPEDQTFEARGKKYKYIETEYNEEGKAVTVKAETMDGKPRNFVSQKIVKGLEDAIGQIQLQALPNQVMVSITDLPPAIQGTILDTREENNQDISEDAVTLEEVQQAISQADPEVQQSLTERTESLFNRQTLEEMPLATFTMKEEWREFQGKTVSAADATLEERQELLNDLAGQDVKQPNGEDIINLPDQGMEAVAERIGQAMRRPTAMSNGAGEVTSYDALNTFMNEGDQGQTILDELQHAYFDLVESGMPIQLFDYLKSLSRHDSSQKGLLHKSSGAAVKTGLSLDNALLTDTKTEKGRRALRWLLGHESWHVLDKNLDISVNLPSFSLEVVPDAEGISIRAGDVIAELYTNYSNDTDLGKVFAYPFNLLSEKTENVNTDLEEAARTVQKEVFAELGALYLSNPRLLKLQAPNAYEVIRTVRDNPELQIGEVADARDQASPTEMGAEGVGVQDEVQPRPVSRGSEVQDGGRVGDDGGRSVETEQADRGLGVEATTTDRDSDRRLVQEQKLAYGVYRIPFNEEGKKDLKLKRLIGEFDSLEEANAYSDKQALDNGRIDIFGNIVDVIKLREKKTPDTQPAETRTPAAKIEDFGEKLGGAIKDQYARFKEALANEEIDAEAVPLSKSFPVPPYQKLAEAGADKQVLAATAMIRGLIGTKPKLRNKLRVWVQDVNAAKDLVRRMTDGEITPEQALVELNLSTATRTQETGVLLAHPIVSEAEPSRLAEASEYRISPYSGFFTRPDGTKVSSKDLKDGGPYEVYRKKGNRYSMGDSFETFEEAQEHLRSVISNLDDKKTTTSTRQSKIEIFLDRKTNKKFLGWQGAYDVIRIKEFDDSSEATEWLFNNREEAEAILASKKVEPQMRREKNLPRTGKGRRDSDKDITPEVFADTFGFRGVEFGNWVEGGKRQQDLNQAFDALIDLADVLKIPTRALSLNGELGLAFGSRGRGGKKPAAAHYEPDSIVINLTKKSGAGSLAHEWWHGVDNYFSRMRGEKGNYITDSPRPLRVRRDGMFMDDDSVRPELLEKFAGVMEAINKSDLRKRSLEQDKKRSKKYWSKPIEMSARSFESFIIRQLELKDITNDYLANISNYEGDADYPYPTPEEAEAIDQAFMGVVEELKTKETDEGKIALFKRGNDDVPLLSRIPESPMSLVSARKTASEKTYNNQREFKVDLQKKAIDEQDRIGIDLSQDTEEANKYLTELVITDAEAALVDNANAIGWYDRTTREAMDILSSIHPELKTDQNSRFSFTYALANLSNGLKVDKNFELAEQAYRVLKETGQFPTNIGIGNAANAINNKFNLYNAMVAKNGVDYLRDLFSKKTTVSELNKLGKQSVPPFEIVGEWASTEVYGSAILGPKIGNGFFSNLNGQFDQLTMDRWVRRTWGRWTGTLISERPDLVAQKNKIMRGIVMRMTAEDKKRFKSIGVTIKTRTNQDVINTAQQIQKSSMLPANRAVMNQTKRGNELRRAGNGLAKDVDGQIEAPTAAERNRIRRVWIPALEKLKETYPDLTMADLQALLWYPEKLLYNGSKSKEEAVNGYEDEEAPDYANAAKNLAEKLGVRVVRGSSGRSAGGIRSSARDASGSDQRQDSQIKTVKVGKPSSKVRPEIARAYKDLQARNITREKFDEIVLETIKPYLDLPTPATTEQLNKALNKRQVVRINLPVPDGLQVGLRLDINAYEKHGTWAVAIHGPNGTEYKSPRYRAFASIKDVNLLLDKEAQLKAQQVIEEKRNKSPFAHMEGVFINRTEQETLQIGQTALESSLSGKPDKDGNMWRQIGFDPRRHASFYDRSTGEFISTADEIIQIGPLVLGKNATTVDSSEVLYARTPSDQTKSHEDAAADGTLMNGQPSNNELTLDDESRSEMFLRKIQDKYLVLKKFQDKAADYLGMTELPDWMNAYQGETLHSGKIKKDFDELEVEYAQPIGEIIRSNQLDLDDVGLYLMAKHAPERNRRIAATNASRIEELISKEAESRQNGEQEKAKKIKEQIEWLSNAASGLSNDQAAEILDASRKDGTANAKEDIAKLVYKMLEQNRQRMQASGLVDEETIDGWNEAYQFYVPLKGFAASEDSDGNLNPPNILPKGFNISGSEVFRALGRKSQSANPVLFALSDVENKIVRAQRNEVSQRFLAMARAVSEQGSDQFRVYEAGDMPIGRKSGATGQLETGRMNVAEVRAATRLDTGDPRFLSVKEDGQEKFIEIKHAGLNRAMHNVGSENYDALVGLIGKGTDFLQKFQNFRRNMLINWNPSWMLINPLRDLQTGLMFNLAQESKDGGMTEGENLTGEILSRYLPAGQAYYKNLRGDQAGNEYDAYYQEYTKTGAPTGMTLTRDIEEQQARLEALVTDGTVKAKGKKALQFIEELNQTSENVIRFATYVSARESGIRAEKAAVLAKDLTVNFNRKGELSSGLNLLYLFFNAAVQGTANLATALSGKTADGKFTKAQIGAASISLLAYLVTQHNLMASEEDEDGESVYNDLNDYDHLMSWNVVLSDGKTFGQLPLPYGYGLFHTLGRLGAEYVNDAKDEGDVVAELAAASAHHILPPPLGFLGSVGQVDDTVEFLQRASSGLAPTIAEPILELGFNQNYFGAPIYIEDNPLMPPTPDSSKAKRSTLDMYKFSAKWLNEVTGGSQYREGFIDLSPDSMQYLVGYTFGGLGRFVSRSSDLSAKMNTDSDTRDDITMSDWPIVRYFHGEPSEYTDKIEYYDNIKAAQEIFIENKETGGGDDAFKRRFGKIVPLEILYKDTQKQLRKLRKSKKLVEREQTDPVKAYDQISKIEAQMQALFDRFNKAYREANK